MYKLSVPIKSATVTAANRKIYLEQCKNAGVERVFLALGTPIYPIPKHIIENVTAFRSEGFEVGVWINTLGHGEVLSHVVSNDILPEFSQIVNIQGEQLQHANCPLDSKFCKFISKYIADLAKTGTNIVMLDDDFRMSFRGAEIACACPMHLIRIGEILGEDITLEQLRPYVLSGKANKYRDAWLKVQEEGLLTLAEEIRAEVDKESPHVNICVCSSVTGWNVDNMDFNKLIHILAGKNKPIFRLTGAPYWASLKGRFSLISTIETSRTIASFCKDTDIELMAEGDVYPRPRYTSPASHLELFDGVMLGDKSADGILKYMFDYVAGPKFETGYLKLHNDNKDFRKNISEWFKDGANAGVKIITHPHTMKNADLDLSTLAIWSPVPYDGTMISSCGIPTVYRTDGICNSVFGENARSYDLSELKKGTILDAVSAVILSERGVDVGLKNFDKLFDKELSFICTNDPEYRSFISNGKVRFLPTELCDSATPVLYFSEPHKKNITAYSYENTNGERFLVFLFEAESLHKRCNSGLLKNYATADALIKVLPWVARKPLPAYCEGNPELYLMCRQDENSMSVALFNCFSDKLVNPVINLSESYNKIECFGCCASLDGNTVTLTSEMYGYTSVAFRVFK